MKFYKLQTKSVVFISEYYSRIYIKMSAAVGDVEFQLFIYYAVTHSVRKMEPDCLLTFPYISFSTRLEHVQNGGQADPH